MKIDVNWLKAAGIRAIKTVAQTAVATIGVSATMGEVNWATVGSTALLAGILSLLTSIGGLPELENGKEPESEGALIVDPAESFLAVNLGQQRLEDVARKKQVTLDVVTEPVEGLSYEGSHEV